MNREGSFWYICVTALFVLHKFPETGLFFGLFLQHLQNARILSVNCRGETPFVFVISVGVETSFGFCGTDSFLQK